MNRTFLPYDPKLKERAQELRNHSTLSEVLLWNQLKRKRIRGYDFHRQKPIDHYIVDFFCPTLMLAIEIDGVSHAFSEVRDEKRQKRIESYGVSFLRFDDLDVKFHMPEVLRTIEQWIDMHAATHPCPAKAGHPLSRGE